MLNAPGSAIYAVFSCFRWLYSHKHIFPQVSTSGPVADCRTDYGGTCMWFDLWPALLMSLAAEAKPMEGIETDATFATWVKFYFQAFAAILLTNWKKLKTCFKGFLNNWWKKIIVFLHSAGSFVQLFLLTAIIAAAATTSVITVIVTLALNARKYIHSLSYCYILMPSYDVYRSVH